MSYTRSKKPRARHRAGTSNWRAAGTRRSFDNVNREEEDVQITESSGNVFVDLGFPPDEAENLLARSQLMLSIEQLIRRKKLTQARAAKLFGVTQPRISDLMRGKIELFSVDSLIEMLGRAGMSVELRVRAA